MGGSVCSTVSRIYSACRLFAFRLLIRSVSYSIFDNLTVTDFDSLRAWGSVGLPPLFPRPLISVGLVDVVIAFFVYFAVIVVLRQ